MKKGGQWDPLYVWKAFACQIVFVLKQCGASLWTEAGGGAGGSILLNFLISYLFRLSSFLLDHAVNP